MTNILLQNQIQILKDRYYQHLTTFDELALSYGKRPFYIKALGYVILFSSSCIFIFTPVLSLLSISLLGFVWILSQHYHAMENRFHQLVSDLSHIEQSIIDVENKNIALTADLIEINKHWDDIQLTLQEKEIQLQSCGLEIEQSKIKIQHLNQEIAQLIALEMGQLQQVLIDVDKLTEPQNKTPNMDNIGQFSRQTETWLLQKFGTQYLEFREQYTQEPMENNMTCI
jgi:hypothetical protein